MSDYQFCTVEKKEHILLITINRPELYNALSPPASRELASIFVEYEADTRSRVAIITGAGTKAFCAGNDVKYTATASREQMKLPVQGFGGLTHFFDRKKPVICAANGITYGGGLELALATDIIVAVEHAKFALPEPKIGLAALGGGIHRLLRQAPLKQAIAMMITGDSVTASEAQQLGFVNKVVSSEKLLETCFEYAEKILACSPVAVSVTLDVAREGLVSASIEDAMKTDTRHLNRIVQSNDFKEGVNSFAEKRKPRWTGT
jgi:enoyl-CoA hydratase/carnithine racemase